MAKARVPLTDKWGLTQVKLDKCTYTWTITNFGYLLERTGEDLESPCFSLGPEKEANWCLKLYPRGINDNFKDQLSLYVCRKDGLEFPSQYTLSVLNKRREKFAEQREECQYNKNYSSWGFPAFLKSDVVNDEANCLLGDNGSLTLCCEIAVVTGSVNLSSLDDARRAQQPAEAPRARQLHRASCLEKLLLDERFSDCRLIAACGKSLPAHKCVLAASSPVFEAMFEHDMLESKANEVEVADLEYEVLREMLRYVYAAKVENVEALAIGLLGAADKYEVVGLRDICEEVMAENMAVENVVEVLLVADRHNVELLKVRAMNFVKAHFAEVVESTGFRTLVHVDTLKNIILAVGQ